MSNIRLRYLDRETASTVATTIDVISVKSWYDFDGVELFPPLQHLYLSGDMDEQIAGFRRLIELDFGVVATYANRKAILYFLIDPDRQIDLNIDAPGNFTATPSSGGTLPATTHYYRVTAVDLVGETTGATEDSAVNATTNLQNDLAWDAVSGATSYRIYRTTSTGDYSGEAHFLAETTTNSYTDTGAVSLTTNYVMPTVEALDVVLAEPGGYSNIWEGGVSLGRRFKVLLKDATLRTTLIP